MPTPSPSQSKSPSKSIPEVTPSSEEEPEKQQSLVENKFGYVSKTENTMNRVLADENEEMEEGEIDQTETVKVVETAVAVETQSMKLVNAPEMLMILKMM